MATACSVVVELVGPLARRATCSCGWRGEQRAQRSDAQADALEHINGRAPARKPKQQRPRGFFA